MLHRVGTYASRFRSYTISPTANLLLSHTEPVCQVVNAVTITLLTVCSTPRSLRDHAAVAARVLATDVDSVGYQLDQLVGSGYLTAVADPLDTTARHEAISVLAVVSADRPTTLRESLSSYLGHCAEHRYAGCIAVADGSRRDGIATRMVVDEVARRHARAVAYWGDSTRAAIINSLRDAEIPDSVLSFALIPIHTTATTVGTVRNLVVLSTAGRTLITADDDTRCDLWAHAARESARLVFAGHKDPSQVDFFESRAEALESRPRCSDSLVSAHERLLGRSAFDLFADAGDQVAFDEPCLELLAAVSPSRPGARVRITVAGIAGDNGQTCVYRSMPIDGPFRRDLSRAPERFRLATTSREVRKIAASPTVGHLPGAMLYCAGIDNSDVVPPFLPMGRNEDGLFRRLLRVTAPDTLVGYIDIGVVHDSHRQSEYPAGLIESASTTRLSDLIAAVISRIVDSRSGVCSLEALGRALLEFTERDNKAFLSDLTAAMVDTRCAELREIEEWTRQHNCGSHWKGAVMRNRETFLSAVREPWGLLPVEMEAERWRGDEAFRLVQRFLADYGALLTWWPKMWAAARQLDVSGAALAGPLVPSQDNV